MEVSVRSARSDPEGKWLSRGVLFHNAQDPNELVVLLEFEDLGTARQFALSDDLQKRMREAGAIDQLDLYFLEKIEEVLV